jgi:O-antigen/teichoic acid export membrane protein
MFLMAGIVFSLTFGVSVVTYVCAALQEGYLTSFATVASQIVSAISVAVVFVMHGSPTAFAAAVVVPPGVVFALLGLYLFGRLHPDLRPRFGIVQLSDISALLRTGGPATVVKFGELALVLLPTVMIANRLGPAAVTPFAVTFSVMYFGFVAVSYYIVPLWPAYVEALARKDREWVMRRFVRSVGVVMSAMTLFCIAMLFVGRLVIRFWAGPVAVPTWPLLASMAAWFWVWGAEACMGTLANGLGLLRERTVSMLACLVVFFAFGWFGLQKWGSPAVSAGEAVGLAVDAVLVGALTKQAWRKLGQSSYNPGRGVA